MNYHRDNQIFPAIFSRQAFFRLFTKFYFFILILLIPLGASYFIVQNNWIFFIISGLLIAFALLIKNPELALAILFNGPLIYFYSVYKLEFETSRMMTGGFYAFLAFSYILGGVLLIARRLHKFRLGSIDVLFICFFLLVFLSYFMFYSVSEAADRKITYAPLLVIAPYFGIRLLSSEERIKKFFKYCVLVTAILIIPAFYELFFNPIFSEYGRFSMYMFPEGGDNPILFGITFAILLIILFVWILEQKKLKSKYLILMVPSMFLLLRSGSRGAVISFLITMLFYIFIIGGFKLKTKVYALVFVALLILGAFKFIPESTNAFYRYTFTPEARESPGSSIYQRITAWEMAVNDFKANPILGVGLGNSSGGSGFPHNILLEVSAELGILGLFLFLAMCYLTIKKAINSIKRKGNRELNMLLKLSLSLFIYSFTGSMFSGYITNQTMLFITMGLVSSIIKINPDDIVRLHSK